MKYDHYWTSCDIDVIIYLYSTSKLTGGANLYLGVYRVIDEFDLNGVVERKK